jgi:hypothetical protein
MPDITISGMYSGHASPWALPLCLQFYVTKRELWTPRRSSIHYPRGYCYPPTVVLVVHHVKHAFAIPSLLVFLRLSLTVSNAALCARQSSTLESPEANSSWHFRQTALSSRLPLERKRTVYAYYLKR